MRQVPLGASDKILDDKEAVNTLLGVFRGLEVSDEGLANEYFTEPFNAVLRSPFRDSKLQELRARHYGNLKRMEEKLGYRVERGPSLLKDGGTGVFVTGGTVPPSSIMALYPGLVYESTEPILIQSLGNPFVFQCIDHSLIDGNDKGFSKFLFKSCCGRDSIGLEVVGDMTWMTPYPFNPLAVGQYVNNATSEYPANVIYQEVNLPHEIPFYLRKYIPNAFYGMNINSDPDSIRLLRLVMLISTREIQTGEELFSNYFTVVHS